MERLTPTDTSEFVADWQNQSEGRRRVAEECRRNRLVKEYGEEYLLDENG